MNRSIKLAMTLAIMAAAILNLTGCAAHRTKIDSIQINYEAIRVLNNQALGKLRIGMSKEEVAKFFEERGKISPLMSNPMFSEGKTVTVNEVTHEVQIDRYYTIMTDKRKDYIDDSNLTPVVFIDGRLEFWGPDAIKDMNSYLKK